MEDTLKQLLERARQAEEEQTRLWSSLPCRREVSQVHACTYEYELMCTQRHSVFCPKRILTQQAATKAERRRQALATGVPERVLRKVYDQPPVLTLAMKAVRTFMSTPDKSILVLSGPNACGKTTAAAWACIPPWEAAWPTPRAGLFARLVDVESAGRYGELLLRIRRSPLVVMDDIGAAHFGQSGFLASLVDDIVDAVYQQCHKIILTTDVAVLPDSKEPGKPCLANLVSKRVMSRIRDAGMVETKLGGRYDG